MHHPHHPVITCGRIYIHVCIVLTFCHIWPTIMHIILSHLAYHTCSLQRYVLDISVPRYIWLAHLLEEHAMLGCTDALLEVYKPLSANVKTGEFQSRQTVFYNIKDRYIDTVRGPFMGNQKKIHILDHYLR